MKLISQKEIIDLNIQPNECLSWVRESFLLKDRSILPPKTSLHTHDIDFFTSMPCAIPELNVFGVKVVHRLNGAVPSLGSDIMLYDITDGELLAIMDGNWITTMRTGAVAVLATQTFRKSNNINYGVIGLGNTARATILCLLEAEPDTLHRIALLKYKDQDQLFIDRFSKYKNVEFSVYENVKDLIRNTDVMYSCLTESQNLVCDDDTAFREGFLLVPIHTRGFQNCDLFFDKVFADDTGHVKGFKYFDRFKHFAEIQDVISGKKPGRESDKERIISYNVGIGLHDIFFANKIYNAVKDGQDVEISKIKDKFWI